MSFGFFVIAIFAGLVGSMSGQGGGIILVPALTFFGFDIKQAIAISNLSVIAISTAAAPGYLRRHMPNFNTGAFLEACAIVGAFGGALITLASGKRSLFFLCGSILLISWLVLRRPLEKSSKPIVQQDALSRWLRLEGSYYDHVEGKTIAYQGTHAALAGLLTFVAGLITGLLGIGGSALMVLILEGVMRLPTKVSLATSNLIIGVVALAGANIYLEAGLINLSLVPPVVLGTSLGAFIGSKFLVHLENREARAVLFGVFIILGVEMIVHGVRGV